MKIVGIAVKEGSMLRNKPALPVFSAKAGEMRSMNTRDSDPDADKNKISVYSEYKDKSLQLKEENTRRIKEKQQKAEIALEQWRRLKFEKFKRNFSKPHAKSKYA